MTDKQWVVSEPLTVTRGCLSLVNICLAANQRNAESNSRTRRTQFLILFHHVHLDVNLHPHSHRLNLRTDHASAVPLYMSVKLLACL
jgi:hypothetical protein